MLRGTSTLATGLRRLSTSARTDPAKLVKLTDSFRFDVEKHLAKDGKGVVLASAFLASDNIIVHLLQSHFPEVFKGFHFMGVNTLHLFDETLDVAAAMEARYGKRIEWFKPTGCETRAEFEARHGFAGKLSHADFDLHSKVEPYTRGLKALGKEVLITGRRMDQGDKRAELDIYEAQPKIFNPLAAWSWGDVTAFVDAHGVPVNAGHNAVFRSATFIDAKERHLPGLPWTKHDLGKPFWRATEAELKGTPAAAHAFVFKSFGDVHTTVPVYPRESERAGRFVQSSQSECGIHTRVAAAGAPHGGKLVDRYVKDVQKAADLLNAATASLELNERQSCDVELLLNGGFSPLTGFMTREEYDHVLKDMRLPEQQLWALPVTLDVAEGAGVKLGDKVKLTYKGEAVAVLEVTSRWTPDKTAEAAAVFGTTSLEHPGVMDLAASRGKVYVGGPIHGLAKPQREMPCASPAEVRAMLPADKGATPVTAFQCRNPLHRSHMELIFRARKEFPEGIVLIHPTVGPTQPGDVDGATRVQTYYALQKEVTDPKIKWAFLPYNMLMAGPREAVQHMIIRKNYGCTKFIIGRDMAGTKSTVTGKDFYGPYDAQEMARRHTKELAMDIVTSENVVYTEEVGYVTESEAKGKGLKEKKLSGTEFRRLLRSGAHIPEWFAYPRVVEILREEEAKAKAQARA